MAFTLSLGEIAASELGPDVPIGAQEPMKSDLPYIPLLWVFVACPFVFQN